MAVSVPAARRRAGKTATSESFLHNVFLGNKDLRIDSGCLIPVTTGGDVFFQEGYLGRTLFGGGTVSSGTLSRVRELTNMAARAKGSAEDAHRALLREQQAHDAARGIYHHAQRVAADTNDLARRRAAGGLASAVADRDAAVAERDAAVRGRSAALAERDLARAARDAAQTTVQEQAALLEAVQQPMPPVAYPGVTMSDGVRADSAEEAFIRDLASELKQTVPVALCRAQGVAYSGTKEMRSRRLALRTPGSRGSRPSKPQLTYLAAQTRRTPAVPLPLEAVTSKAACQAWLSAHGDYN